MEVPPPNFNEQFAKDLLIDEVTNLNQLKWIFDGNKIPAGSDFKKEDGGGDKKDGYAEGGVEKVWHGIHGRVEK
jgi:hypothetical protein